VSLTFDVAAARDLSPRFFDQRFKVRVIGWSTRANLRENPIQSVVQKLIALHWIEPIRLQSEAVERLEARAQMVQLIAE
jgi:hypothetical protein